MIRTGLTSAVCFGISTLLLSPINHAVAADAEHPVVVIDTTAGPITIELDRTKAPMTVDNFLKYVDKGYYEGTSFHRVIKGFMIQTGGMTETGGVVKEKPPLFPPVKNESANSMSNARGTIAMARTPDPDSATSQFFISVGNNAKLDHAGGGYTAFGKVTDGMKVVDAIAVVATTTKPGGPGGMSDDVPVKPITIKSVKRKE